MRQTPKSDARQPPMPELAADALAAWGADSPDPQNPEYVHHSPGDGYSAHMGTGTNAGAMSPKARYLMDLNGFLHLSVQLFEFSPGFLAFPARFGPTPARDVLIFPRAFDRGRCPQSSWAARALPPIGSQRWSTCPPASCWRSWRTTPRMAPRAATTIRHSRSIRH